MITPLEPNVAPTGRYSIGETCKALGIHRNTLRKYVQSGLIKQGMRRSGRPFFLGIEIIRFWKAVL